ncbi:MAG: hypothetical protein AAFR33_00565 [Pseudomonadota bacterium]
MRSLLMAMALGCPMVLAGCESLPLDLPGQDERAGTATPTPDAAGAPSVSRSEVADPDTESTGLAGAALCVSSAYYLADLGAIPEEQGVAYAERWTSILEVIPANQPEARQQAVNDAYAVLEQLDADGSQSGFEIARGQMQGDTCTNTEFQREYLARWGDPELMSQRLEGAQ